jgi:hypothetical protein
MVSAFMRPSRLAAIAAVPVLLAASAPPTGGTSYEFIVRSTSTQTGNKESVMMRGRGTFAGDDAKIEIIETGGAAAANSNAFGGKGSYFLVVDGGKKMLLVDPSQKTYLEWDMQSMIAGMAKMVNALGGLVKMDMSDVKIDAQDMGPGEKVQGYQTKHVRMTQNYTVTAKLFGKSSKSRSETTVDYYFAPALKALVNPFVQNSQAWASSLDMFNNADYKSQMAAAQSKVQGVPVKTVVRTVSTDEKGKQQTSVVTTEMVNFKNVDVPSATFAIPTGYQLVQLPKLDAGAAGAASGSTEGSASGSGESIGDATKEGAKEGVKDATKEVTKEAAKETAKKKLKGIFKR